MSQLTLNEPGQYKSFSGSNIEQMPKLIKEGRLPISVAGLMQRRLDVLDSNVSEEVRDSWWNNYFDTGDAPAYDTQGNLKIILDAQPLRELTPQSKLQNGALVLPEGTYTGLPEDEFTKEQLAHYTEKRLNKGESINNPLWRALARGDKTLLKEYDTAAFVRAKEFGYDPAMGIFLALPQDKESMRLWCLGSIINGQSDASSGRSLGNVNGRFVGVAPEAHVAQKIGVSERIVAPTLEQVLLLAKE